MRHALNAHMALGFPRRRSTPRSTASLPRRAIAVTLRKSTA